MYWKQSNICVLHGEKCVLQLLCEMWISRIGQQSFFGNMLWGVQLWQRKRRNIGLDGYDKINFEIFDMFPMRRRLLMHILSNSTTCVPYWLWSFQYSCIQVIYFGTQINSRENICIGYISYIYIRNPGIRKELCHIEILQAGGSMRKNFDFYSIRNDNNKRISDSTRFGKISGAKQWPISTLALHPLLDWIHTDLFPIVKGS